MQLFSMEQLTQSSEVLVSGCKQPSIADMLWQHYFAKHKYASLANISADEHLSQLVGYKVSYFTAENN